MCHPYTHRYSQIERDTLGKQQCHPYPHNLIDPSRQCAHSVFFMGLRRKQGEAAQKFDVRATVDEFRNSTNMYSYRKPGMDMRVSHVLRNSLPAFVFPKRSRQSMPQVMSKYEAQVYIICEKKANKKAKNQTNIYIICVYYKKSITTSPRGTFGAFLALQKKPEKFMLFQILLIK